MAIAATLRSDLGKGASRRLRRNADHVPAIIYGAGKDPAPITLIRKDLEKALESEAFYSQVIDVSVDGDVQPAILKDLQRHPAKDRVMHADFMRIDAKKKLKVNIQLHFVNEEECHGVRIEGGVVEHLMTEIEVECLPGNIPEYIEVDMTDVTTDDVVHISDLKLPEGVVSTDLALGEEHDMAVASVSLPRAAIEEDEGEDDVAPDEVEASEQGGSDDEESDD
jgi:large subunit ribosomal protein L25